MDYAGIEQMGNDIVLREIKHFDLAQTLDNGQAFRWAATGENQYSGIAHGQRLVVEARENNLVLKNVTEAEFDSLWCNYFDLNRSYAQLRDTFSTHETLKKALAFSPGLRLMRQEPWEVLVSFILSQNSNIPRIKKMILELCANFGAPLPGGGHAFPTAQVLATKTPQNLDVIKCGYRAPYIIDAAKQVASGKICFDTLSVLPTDALRAVLQTIHGVGPKVADCVSLFGLARVECFPLDVWMMKVTAKLYPDGLPAELQEHAGIAQQFLFHYARNHASEFV